MFFTRLPVPAWVGYSEEQMNRAARYFPLIGVLVGAWGALVFVAADALFRREVALLLSMVATIQLTGAFHEDGFADFCDGFSRGGDHKTILLRMKTSTLGAPGVIGLTGMLTLKFFALQAVPNVALALLVGHGLSRWFAISMFYTMDYAREDDTGKSKPMAKRISLPGLLFAGATVSGVALLLPWTELLLVLTAMLTARLALGALFTARLGGYTGDCAGALQQVCEVAGYVALATWLANA